MIEHRVGLGGGRYRQQQKRDQRKAGAHVSSPLVRRECSKRNPPPDLAALRLFPFCSFLAWPPTADPRRHGGSGKTTSRMLCWTPTDSGWLLFILRTSRCGNRP